MPQFAVLIYAADSAHEPGESAATSPAIAECDEHAQALSSPGSAADGAASDGAASDEATTDAAAPAAVMTAAWAFTPRREAVSVDAAGRRSGPMVDGPRVVAGVYFLEADDLESAVATAATNPVITAGGGVEVRPVHSGGLVGG